MHTSNDQSLWTLSFCDHCTAGGSNNTSQYNTCTCINNICHNIATQPTQQNKYTCQERGTTPSSFSKVFDVVRKLIKMLVANEHAV